MLTLPQKSVNITLTTTQRDKRMTTLKELNQLQINFSFSDICKLIGSPLNKSKSNIKEIINNCDDVETLKTAAVKFDGIHEFFPIEDRLIKIIGEDCYYDFADYYNLA